MRRMVLAGVFLPLCAFAQSTPDVVVTATRIPTVIEQVPAGDHELIVEVRGNLKNLLGPHFSDGLPGPWSWQAAPQPQPAGRQYKFTETGLREAPRCWVAGKTDFLPSKR